MADESYCCDTMARWSQPSPDRLINHTPIVHMPGIRIDDRTSVVIVFCPWCGKQVFDNSGLGGHRVTEVSRTGT
jgi:hypothetical protein